MAGVLRVSITGQLPNNEVWSVNPVWLLGTGDFPLSYDDLNTIATAINNVSVPTGIRAYMTASTTITGCRLEQRTLSGDLLAQFEQQRGSAVPGTGSGALPMQAAVVTSLRTTSSGASYRGRMYWPATGATLLSSTLRFEPTTLGAHLAGVKTLLSGITTAISATNASSTLQVWSRTLSSSAAVNRVLAGDVPDVQRRRRDQAIETYQTLTYP
jgi:hypothetical protein